MEIAVTRIDNAIKIIPAPPYLVKYLQYTHRGMEMVGWKKEAVYTKIQLHRQCDDGGIVTFRGFFQRIKALIEENDDTMVVDDRRTPLPEIDREAVLNIDFRAHQIPLMVEILEKMDQDDGIVWVATGAGKTHLSAGIYAAYNSLNTILVVPLAAVATQTYKIFKGLFPDKDIGLMGGGGSSIGDDITITTLASLDKCSLEKCRLLLVDEIQCTTSERVQNILTSIPAIRTIGFTATDKELFNKGDKVLTALYGDRLCEMDYQDAEAINAVVPGVVYFLEVPETGRSYRDFDGKMKYLIKNYEERNRMMGQVCAALPADWQSIVFVDHVADHLVNVVKGMPAGTKWIHRNSSKVEIGTFALTPKQQKQVMQDFKDNQFKHLVATDLARAGVDVVNVRCVVQGSGGSSVVELLQEAGRGARIIPEERRLELGVSPKTHFVLIDFLDNHDTMLSNMSKGRRKLYAEQGWTIRDVQSVNQIDFLDYGQHEAKL